MMNSILRASTHRRPCRPAQDMSGWVVMASFGSSAPTQQRQPINASNRPPEKNGSADSMQTHSDNSSANKKQHVTSYGMSNFRALLQHQSFSRKFHDTRNKSERDDFSRRREIVLSQSQDPDFSETVSSQKKEEVPPKTKTAHETATTNNYDASKEGNHSRAPHEKHRWRSQPSRPYQSDQATDRQPKRHVHRKPRVPIATSEWILVSNVPPMSELSDLCLSLNQILDYEVRKGIIDLDAVGNLGYAFRDSVTSSALKRIGAIGTLYSTHAIDDLRVPLWTTTSSDQSRAPNDVCPMILDARVHLSHQAQPMGWFLRLPNRSVVHAVLNHVRRAEDYRKQRRSNRDDNLQEEKRKWREGLWKGVWTEHEKEIAEQEHGEMLKDESHDEKELISGDGLGAEEDEDSSVSNPFEETDEVTQSSDVEEQQDDIDDYLQKYLESNPYPIQSTKSCTNRQYQLLKSGSTILNVQEFSPNPSHFHKNQHPTWEQHSFHLSQVLNLSDSMIRVETSDLMTNVKDIEFLFRGYDFDSILPVPDDSATLQSRFAEIPKSLGWNISSKDNVGRLIEGTHAPRLRHFNFSSDKDRSLQRAPRHAFLVKLATPNDARMALRDKQGTLFHRGRLFVAQYPRPWIDRQ